MKLKDWYEFKFPIIDGPFTGDMIYDESYKLKYVEQLKSLFIFMEKEGIKHWWFLWYESYILVRFKRPKDYAIGALKFYEESDAKFDNATDLRYFVKVMCETTKLVKKKLGSKKPNNSVKLMERTFHCTWNQLYGRPDERKFHRDLVDNGDDLSQFDFNDFKNSMICLTKE